MQLVQNNDYVLFFGDADNACEPQLYKNETAISVLEQEPFVSFQKYNSTSAFLLLHQIHGSTGVVIESLDQAQEYVLYSQEGDFLVTNISGITLGVLTADCLPVVVIDTKNKIIGAAHAGWKGALNGVVPSMIMAMQERYGSKLQDLVFECGPCIQVCCYKVDQLFKDAFINNNQPLDRFVIRDGQLYFNLLGFVTDQLSVAGIVYTARSLCTLCNNNFCSYRRNKTKKRQISGISLK